MGEVEAAMAGRDPVADARRGDASAFALLLDPLWEPAYRLAYTMLRIAQRRRTPCRSRR
jgi:hypothetical protein